MRQRRIAFLVVPVVLLLIGAFAAQAGAVTIAEFGTPVETSSWSVPIYWWPGPLFDTMEAFMLTPGVDFEDPGISISHVQDNAANDVTALWESSLINPDYSLATGVESQQIWFSANFTSNIADPLEFDTLLWNSGNFLYGIHASWDGSGWTQTFITSLEGKDYDRTAVPEPSTIALLASGLVALAGARRSRGFRA